MEISGRTLCKPCKRNNARNNAHGLCQECGENTCTVCFRQHVQMELCRNHTFVSMKYVKPSDSEKDNEKSRLRENESIKFGVGGIPKEKKLQIVPETLNLGKLRIDSGGSEKDKGNRKMHGKESTKVDEKGIRKESTSPPVVRHDILDSGNSETTTAKQQLGEREGIMKRMRRGLHVPYIIRKQIGFSASAKLDMDAYKKELDENGVAGVKNKLNKDLDKLNDIEINFAVIGRSGAGKSSFINSFRGLKASDPGAAEVGVNETSTKCLAYVHPENNSFIVWDIPGIGTPDVPKETYLKVVSDEKYDFFIIMTKDRFMEYDLWLALEVQKLGKKFFFVRSHIDVDVGNQKADYPENHDEDKLVGSIRIRTENELRNRSIKFPKVFMISNRKTDKYDFGSLAEEALRSCEGLKKDAMALSLTIVTQTVMAEKKRILEDRIAKVALAVACTKNKYEQKGRFKEEIELYQKQFNIDKVTLAENKHIFSISNERIEEYKVLFDERATGKETELKTPTASRKEADAWDRFVDWFRWSKENTLLYRFCKVALSDSLDILYDQACNFYDINTSKQMVYALAKAKLESEV